MGTNPTINCELSKITCSLKMFLLDQVSPILSHLKDNEEGKDLLDVGNQMRCKHMGALGVVLGLSTKYMV